MAGHQAQKRVIILPQVPNRREFTYSHPRIPDLTLDENLPVLPLSTEDRFAHRSPQTHLGALQVLPPELLLIGLSQLDLHFRRVNRRALDIVDFYPPYKAINVHARTAIRGILAIGTGEWITPRDLYNSLCRAQCSECDDFAGYLYVLTCKRVCFLCFTKKPRYLPLRHGHAIRKYGITSGIIETLPRMSSVSGTYSPCSREVPERVSLVDSESVRQAGITLHGSLEAMKQYVADQRHELKPEEIIDGQLGNPLRFVAVVRLPWFDQTRQELNWGFHCKGCEKLDDDGCFHPRRKYTESSFKKHLDIFGGLRDGLYNFTTRHGYPLFLP